MDIEKAIDCLKADKEYLTDMKICDGEEMDIAIKTLEEVQQYRSIGTLYECRLAVEKMKPKRPINRCMFSECPTCGNVEIKDCKHCPDCGQALIL